MTPSPTSPSRPARRISLKSGLSRKIWLISGISVLSLGGLGLGALQSVSAQDDPAAAAQGLPSAPQPYKHSLLAESRLLSDSEAESLQQALSAVKQRRYADADSIKGTLSSPIARKIVTWAIINNDGNIYGFAALDGARRDLWGWPRETKRQIAAEKLMSTSGLTARQIVDWFSGAPPKSVDGATQLIKAYADLGRTDEASALAKRWWRTQVFDPTAQGNFYQAFGNYLTQDDHKARLACLMLNTQSGSSQAIKDLAAYVDGHPRDIANAVVAMRSAAANSDVLYQQALNGDPHNSLLAFARAKYLNGKGLEPLGFALLPDLPPASLSPDAASQIYSLRLAYFRAALKAHDYEAAYNAMNGGGFEPGESMAESEFFAGWVALVKLNKPDLAITHFQALATAGTSPITQGRANYWLGRAYEARNAPAVTNVHPSDADIAHAYYVKGSEFIYAFYGQMAAEKAGVKTITLGKDPKPSEADKARFDNRDLVQAARILGSIGEIDLFRSIVLNLDTVLPNAEEEALLVDMTAMYDTQVMAMKVARMSMQRGFYLPERAYPVRDVPDVPAPEKAFVLAITRQESGFDPSVRSRANAKGMMQLIPSTAKAVARRLNLPYAEQRLYEPDFNMSLGAYHLGELVTRFDGSYIMAAAGYNAGPSRMKTWITDCGDPRGETADALSFIECMPLRETRDYMMRVTENMRIYRARLAGGSAPLTAMADVARGIPAPIDTTPDDEGDGNGGDGSDGPISYLEYQKAQTENAAVAAQLTALQTATKHAPSVAKPVVASKVEAKPSKSKPEAKKPAGKKAEAKTGGKKGKGKKAEAKTSGSKTSGAKTSGAKKTTNKKGAEKSTKAKDKKKVD